MSYNVNREILTDDSIASTRAGQTHNCAPVAQAGSVIQQMSDRQWRTVIRQLGNVFPHGIVETELSILLQQYERCGGNCFATEPDSKIV